MCAVPPPDETTGEVMPIHVGKKAIGRAADPCAKGRDQNAGEGRATRPQTMGINLGGSGRGRLPESCWMGGEGPVMVQKVDMIQKNEDGCSRPCRPQIHVESPTPN